MNVMSIQWEKSRERERATTTSVATGRVWSPKMIAARLREAMLTIAAMPLPPRALPSQAVTISLPLVRSYWEAYGQDPARSTAVVPAPEKIARAYEAIEWTLCLGDADRLLLLGVAARVGWKKMQPRLGFSERHLRRMHRKALMSLTCRLNSVSSGQ